MENLENTLLEHLSDDLSINVTNIRTIMESSSDLLITKKKIAGQDVAVILCEGMISTDTLALMIYNPLNDIAGEELESIEVMHKLQNELLISSEQAQVQTYGELIHYIMSGFVVILIDGVGYGTAIGVQGFQYRSVEVASTHHNVRSSREGFTEVVRTNIAMVRRRVKSPTLVFRMMTLGDRSNTDICLCYISDKADINLVQNITEKLQKIDINTILEGGYLQPFLEEKTSLVFSEIGTTEKPDTLAAKLYEGRVGIIIDGTPFALYLPHLLVENFQTMDDYSGMPIYMVFMRILKYIGFAMTVLLPGFYIALANFHPELFPNILLFNLSSSVASMPFPLLAECIIIQIIYEIMREAGLRLPSDVGHAVSIVGGLVVGDIVVSAGLVGAPLVLIAAISAISSFVVPDIYDSIIVLRFAFIFAGGLWGLYGLTLLGVVVLLKMCSMSNYGIPYTAPFSPFTLKAMRDSILRVSWRTLAKDDVRVQDLNGTNIPDVNTKV